ncbi:G-box binding factor [Tieghemostelium lacteum]|uniref:G-box binding factor n=1 Tax=Tieghemostelium lacteum TaxID=361077 RepID=A0A151ZKL7_TIELA|nr:G-box binding factor [Tieghemostelium lacteum]|eukprot:KYQ94449.1 G-box binding factor [Tieghemostelium lacteum]
MLPLPSLFQSNQPSMIFGNSQSLLGNSSNSPSFLLPNNPLMSNHQGVFNPHESQQFPDMPNLVDQYQIHPQQASHYNQHFQNSFPQHYLIFQHQQQQQQQQQPNGQHPGHHQGSHQAHGQQQQMLSTMTSSHSTNTPSQKGKRKAVREEEKKDPNAPVSIPKCTRCNENASWRHDKRRWWCKECKKAFTPGITKNQNTQQVQTIQNPQLPTNPMPQGLMYQGQMMSPLPQWDNPGSQQSTPGLNPNNQLSNVMPTNNTNNNVAQVPPTCPNCRGLSGWKHDKKRWYCKECRKPFTPNLSSSNSPSKTKKSSTPKVKKQNVNGTSSSGNTPLLNPGLVNIPISPSNLLPSQMHLQMGNNFQVPPFSPISNGSLIPPNLKNEINLSPPRPSSQNTLIPSLSTLGHHPSVQNHISINSISLLNGHNSNNNSTNNNNSNHNNHNNNTNNILNGTQPNSSNNGETSLSSIISSQNDNAISSSSLLNSLNGNQQQNLQNGNCSPSTPKKQKKKDSTLENGGVQVLVNVDNTVLNPIITGDNSNGVSESW